MQQRPPNEIPDRALRVLHVIPTLSGGGAENVLCALVSCFDSRIVEAGLMAIYPTAVPPGERLAAIPLLKIERSGRYDPGFFGRMLRAMREFKPDIVHAHLHNGKYWGRLAALIARVPIVVFTEHSPRGEPRMFAEKTFDAAVDRLTDGTITFTEYQRKVLESEGVPAAKLSVIENGITLPPLPTPQRRSDARRRLGARDDEFVVMAVGRLVPIKNKRLAVEAMKHVSANARERLRMYVIGGGEEEAFLRELARSQGISDIVRFTGHRDDAIDLLYGGDALYMPSHVEGMPLAVLEAMSVGLPVISTPWAGVTDLLGNGELGIIVDDWEPQTSAAAFERVMNGPQKLGEIGERARTYAREHYDIERVAQLHETFYVDLARRKGLFARPHAEPVAVQ